MWGCTVREAQQRCDAREFAEWKAFDQIRPFGEHRIMILLADLCAMFFNAHRGDSKALSQADFLPFMKCPATNPQAVDQQQQMLELISAAMGVQH